MLNTVYSRIIGTIRVDAQSSAARTGDYHRIDVKEVETTEVRPIRTKRDLEAALKEIELLWGAKTGTPKGDWLGVLATLVDAYEAEHYPIDSPDPIEAIKFRMEQQGLTRRDLEEIHRHAAPGSPKS
jgi:antitoxin component HigA of HigAB toxin-antitoxin module